MSAIKKVYLDNGATTRVDDSVVDTMLPFFEENYGNASSLHSFGRDAKVAVEHARATIAKKINALPEEIIFTSSGTEADNLAILGVSHDTKKNHIILSKIEHHAVHMTCEALESKGVALTYLDVDPDGFIDLNQLKRSITDKTLLVTIIHANNEIGTIQDIDAIGKICKEKKVLFHIDAVQSFTKVQIDVKKTHVDLISMSSHKIHGPKGVGALYVRKGIKIRPILHGGGHERGIRPGTENVPGIVGFGKASELDPEIEKMTKQRDYLINELLKISETKLNGSRSKRLCNNVNISFKYVEGEGLLMHLDLAGIAVSTGSACSSHSLEASHVLLAIGLTHEIAHGSIRFTLSKYTTKDELDYTVRKVKEIVEQLRKFSPLMKNV